MNARQVRNPKCIRHGLVACRECVVISDAARRISDLINAVVTFKGWDELNGGYMAFRLDDGSSNATLYDCYADAVKHTDEQRHFYFCFNQAMGGANPRDCQLLLEFNRYVVEAGIPRAEPTARRMVSPILSIKGYDIMSGRRGI